MVRVQTTMATVLLAVVVFVVAGGIGFTGSTIVEDARQEPVVVALATEIDGERVLVRHESGSRLTASELDLVVRGSTDTTRIQLDAFTRRGDGDATLTAGETYAVGHGLNDETAEVRVVHRPTERVLVRGEHEVPRVGVVPNRFAPIEPYTTDGRGEAGSLAIVDGTYRLDGTTRHAITFEYTVTIDTLLVFEFTSDDEGRLHAIGLGTADGSVHPLYKLYGGQAVGSATTDDIDETYDTYVDGEGWVRYEIAVGDAFQGDVSAIVLVNENGTESSAQSEFRNLRVVERDRDG